MERFEAGHPVFVETTKWGGRPHWQYTGAYLGVDELGDWVGFPAGTHNHRPGMEFHSEVDTVMLVPRHGAYLPAFHAPGIWCDLYVDIATPAEWGGADGAVLHSVDLDLDVIRLSDGTVKLDDEDEFEHHQIAYGYPAEIIALAEEWTERVYAAVLAGEPPFDGRAEGWLERLASGPRG